MKLSEAFIINEGPFDQAFSNKQDDLKNAAFEIVKLLNAGNIDAAKAAAQSLAPQMKQMGENLDEAPIDDPELKKMMGSLPQGSAVLKPMGDGTVSFLKNIQGKPIEFDTMDADRAVDNLNWPRIENQVKDMLRKIPPGQAVLVDYSTKDPTQAVRLYDPSSSTARKF